MLMKVNSSYWLCRERKTVLLIGIILGLLLAFGVDAVSAHPIAQSDGEGIDRVAPGSFQVAPVDLEDPDPEADGDDFESDAAGAEISAASHRATPRRFIIDTDTGVDDAAALLGLLSQQKYAFTV